MNIGLVGGLDRTQRGFEAIAKAHGHQLETHNGNLVGAAATGRLRQLVQRADRVLVVTDVNSHNAVKLTRRLAAQARRPVSLLRRLGQSQFVALLASWEGGPPPGVQATRTRRGS